jgi:MFS family permease
MFFVNMSSFSLYIAVIIVGFVSGGTFTLMGIIAHEEHGHKHVGKILGIFMTAGAVGIIFFDEVVFDLLYHAMASD